MRVSPGSVAPAISTARMLRLSSTDQVDLRPPAWGKQVRKFVRASSSIGGEHDRPMAGFFLYLG